MTNSPAVKKNRRDFSPLGGFSLRPSWRVPSQSTACPLRPLRVLRTRHGRARGAFAAAVPRCRPRAACFPLDVLLSTCAGLATTVSNVYEVGLKSHDSIGTCRGTIIHGTYGSRVPSTRTAALGSGRRRAVRTVRRPSCSHLLLLLLLSLRG